MDTISDINARFEPGIDADSEAAQRRHALAQQVTAVRRRSKRIHLLRTALPALIIALGLLNVGWIAISSIIGSLNVYDTKSADIRMTNPRFSGLSGSNSPFNVSGLELIKKAGDTTFATLKAPAIDFKGDGDKSTHISAASGLYDSQAKTFRLDGNVVMVSSGSDMTFRTEQAVINLKDLTVSGDKHIEGDGSMGHIVGESFAVSKNGNDVVFRGRGDVKAHGVLNHNNTPLRGTINGH